MRLASLRSIRMSPNSTWWATSRATTGWQGLSNTSIPILSDSWTSWSRRGCWTIQLWYCWAIMGSTWETGSLCIRIRWTPCCSCIFLKMWTRSIGRGSDTISKIQYRCITSITFCGIWQRGRDTKRSNLDCSVTSHPRRAAKMCWSIHLRSASVID